MEKLATGLNATKIILVVVLHWELTSRDGVHRGLVGKQHQLVAT